MSRRHIKIATRGSDLARWQAEHVRELILGAEPSAEVELLLVKTRGDKILDVPLAKVGGKGLFIKEIEEALLDRRADLAVHSMKDVPADLEAGLEMAAISERGDPRDVIASREPGGLDAVPQGGRVGTSSLRRACLVKALRPDVETASLRGNVQTRLAKLDRGDFDAIVLAACGLERLGLGARISQRLEPGECLPAVGQGALGVEIRAGDEEMRELCRRSVHHEADARRVMAERAFLAEIGGGCHAPLGAFAVYEGEELLLDAFVGQPDGTGILRARRRGLPSEAESLGRAAARDLLEKGAGDILAALGQT